MNNRIVFAVLILFFYVVPSHSAPTINNISGTLSHGSTVMISGSGFGTKSTALPLVWDTFEGQTIGSAPSANATIGTWDKVESIGGDLSITGSVVYTGNRGVVTGNTANGRSFMKRYVLPSNSGKAYLSIKRRYSVTPSWNQKFFYFYPASSTYPSVVASYHTGGVWGVQNGDLGHWFNSVPPANTWIMEEYIIKNNSFIGAADGTIRYDRNGVTIFNQTNAIMRSSGEPDTLERWYFSNYSETASVIYQDDLYFDNTWARIMIGDGSTFSSSKKRELQIPTEWSDSNIVIKFNQGAFQTGQTVYIFVIDSNGNVNAQGYSLVLGGALSPDAPTGLKIVN